MVVCCVHQEVASVASRGILVKQPLIVRSPARTFEGILLKKLFITTLGVRLLEGILRRRSLIVRSFIRKFERMLLSNLFVMTL